jgi:hypothetical protein
MRRRRGPDGSRFPADVGQGRGGLAIVGTILAHFGITTERVIREFGLSQDWIMELARQGVTWALEW